MGRVYRAPADSPYQLRFNRDIDFSVIPRSVGEDDLYWGDRESDCDNFALLWDETEFHSHVDAGETEFIMTGTYGLSEWSSDELSALWEAGMVTMPEPPELAVYIRPRDYVTVYSTPDGELVWSVKSGAAFEEAVQYRDTVSLLPLGENPYGDPSSVNFRVVWSREEYEAGMESGAETFSVSGVYGDPDGDALKGWVRAEGTAQARVVVEQETGRPEEYRDYYFDISGEPSTYVTHTTPQDRFETLILPATVRLYLEGTTPFDQKSRAFSLLWDRAEYEAGLASGQDSFTLTGGFGPGVDWSTEDVERWDAGGIQVASDVPAPRLEIRLVREEQYPFTVEVVYRAGDYLPQFRFSWLNGAEELICAISFDKETWYEKTAYAEDSSRWNADPEEFPGMWSGWYDENWDEIVIPENGVFYAKITATGSALAGPTDVYELKPTGEDGNWEMIPDDGGTGDHGGGGQGEHDRPGKEDPDTPPPDAVPEPSTTPDPEPDPDHPKHSSAPGGGSRPVPVRPTPFWPMSPSAPEAVPSPSPSPAPEPPDAEPAPTRDPTPPEAAQEEALAALEEQPMQEAPAVSAPSGGREAARVPGAEPEAAETPNGPEPSPSEAPAEEDALPAATPAPQTPAPAASPQAPAIPGFAAATAATAAVLLAGAAWVRLRRRK